jgi:hypothetical protein
MTGWPAADVTVSTQLPSVSAMAGFEVDGIGAKEGSLAARHCDLRGDDDGRVVIIVAPVFFDVKTAGQVRDGVVIHILEAAVLRARVVMVIARRETAAGWPG